MKLKQLVSYLDKELDLAGFAGDHSNNGLQVEGKDEVSHLIFGVDACQELFDIAAEKKADFVFVHHGLSWGGEPRRFTGIVARRLEKLFNAGISLYAAHLPLDAHPQWGNNAQLAEILGLKEIEPFCRIDGMTIGWAGSLSRGVAIEKVVTKLKAALGDPECNFYGDPDVKVKKVAIVSGGCSEEVLFQAAEVGADLLLTGEFKHQLYHPARELGMNVIAAGHYATETTGVKAVMALIQEKFGIEVEFADCPTGL